MMSEKEITIFLLVLAVIALGVIVAVARSVIREMQGGLGDDDEDQAWRMTTEERKNERIRKEIEQWREGR